MIYFDTNILIYNTIEQDIKKSFLSEKIIKEAILDSNFCISSLVLSEYIFTLSKLKIIDKCGDKIEYYSKFCKFDFSVDEVINAYSTCFRKSKCRNINDFIHLEIANRYCDKILTFDSDYKNLKDFYKIDIEILKT